jgi:hypothetical protein
MREDALGRSRIASCSPELAAAARIAAYGQISGRGSEEERVEVGTVAGCEGPEESAAVSTWEKNTRIKDEK